MQTMSVPMHKVVLGSDLVQGEVIVGVRPALPVPGVHVILGNIVAGHRVWASGSAPLVGSTKPIEATKQDDGVTEVLDSFTECVVTRAKSRGKTVKSENRNGYNRFQRVFPLRWNNLVYRESPPCHSKYTIYYRAIICHRPGTHLQILLSQE